MVIAHASEKVKEGKGDANTYIERGQAYLIKLDYERALSDFSTQLDSMGEMGCKAHYWCGKVQQALDQKAEALEYFNRALKIQDGNHAPVYVSRGEVMLSLGKLRDAESDASKALDHDKNLGDAFALQGTVWLELGRTQLKDATDAWKAAEGPAAVQLAQKVKEAKNKAELYRTDAINSLNKAIEVDSSCSKAYAARSQVNFLNGDLAAAFADYTQATELDPKLIGATAEKTMAQIKLEKQLSATADSKLLRTAPLIN